VPLGQYWRRMRGCSRCSSPHGLSRAGRERPSSYRRQPVATLGHDVRPADLSYSTRRPRRSRKRGGACAVGEALLQPLSAWQGRTPSDHVRACHGTAHRATPALAHRTWTGVGRERSAQPLPREPDLGRVTCCDDEALDSCCDTHRADAVAVVDAAPQTHGRSPDRDPERVDAAGWTTSRPTYAATGAIPAEIANASVTPPRSTPHPRSGSGDCSPTPPTAPAADGNPNTAVRRSLREFAIFRDHTCRLSRTHPRHRPPPTPHQRRTHHRRNGQHWRRTRTSYETTPTSTSAPQRYQHRPPDEPQPTRRATGPDARAAARQTPPTSTGPCPPATATPPNHHQPLGHGSTAPTTRSVMELELTLMIQRETAAS
jgi:hypothetical protein